MKGKPTDRPDPDRPASPARVKVIAPANTRDRDKPAAEQGHGPDSAGVKS
jgi:hypothetical protein